MKKNNVSLQDYINHYGLPRDLLESSEKEKISKKNNKEKENDLEKKIIFNRK